MTDDIVARPLDDPAWRAHLFRTRSEEQIGRWARSLTYFRFCRGRTSPFLKEPDELLVALRWDDREDRAALFTAVGLDEGPAGWQDLAGVRVRVVNGPARVTLSVSGVEQRRPEIVDRDIESALKVEEALVHVADRVIDPPRDDRSCVSPHLYLSLFEPTDDQMDR